MKWLSIADYNQWRDVGMRGFASKGNRDPSFKGPLAGRNASFTDLMVRTGMRLTEQSVLLLTEIPMRRPDVAHAKVWITARTAKNMKGRHIYVPNSVLSSIDAYVRGERRAAVKRGTRNGLYSPDKGWFVINERNPKWVLTPSGMGRRLSSLAPVERARVLVLKDAVLQPACLWLTDKGAPMSSKTWQGIFAVANARCVRLGINLSAHPHALRHTYAVATLDKLQRGHLSTLEPQNEPYRKRYVQVFGDPLNWLRLRLGHSSADTTAIYLHTLAELDYETRLALIPDDEEWELPSEAAADFGNNEADLDYPDV
ncbi:tyrosine-type recombinase/integrase [Cryobacterium sp. 10C2]|nr:tyrosine-type recombinase/integrase [Cryobacterium sp. 10C2]MDY7528157.1 tyrosine-type recombinase/integrase [Cryobacterium sp. 10C2]MEB0289344.1 tyrosine-type recombinase/integrase [Cryobacterium sp. 10C2]